MSNIHSELAKQKSKCTQNGYLLLLCLITCCCVKSYFSQKHNKASPALQDTNEQPGTANYPAVIHHFSPGVWPHVLLAPGKNTLKSELRPWPALSTSPHTYTYTHTHTPTHRLLDSSCVTLLHCD